jgi:hypothetical protein
MLLEELNFLTAFLENPNLCCGDELDQRKSNSYKKLDTLMYEIETTIVAPIVQTKKSLI